MLIIFLI